MPMTLRTERFQAHYVSSRFEGRGRAQRRLKEATNRVVWNVDDLQVFAVDAAFVCLNSDKGSIGNAHPS